MRAVRVLTAATRERFWQFLQEHHQGKTIGELAALWNKPGCRGHAPKVNNDRVAYWLEKLHLKLTKADYIRLPTMRAKQSRAQRKRRAQERAELESALRDEKQAILQRDPRTLLRRCQGECAKKWPLTRRFFPYAGGTAKYFLSTCILCYHHLAGTAQERRALRRKQFDADTDAQIERLHQRAQQWLDQHAEAQAQQCAECHRRWPITARTFPIYTAKSSAKQLHRKTCRFCLRKKERRWDRARRAALVNQAAS
jgi:hypothetical protein